MPVLHSRPREEASREPSRRLQKCDFFLCLSHSLKKSAFSLFTKNIFFLYFSVFALENPQKALARRALLKIPNFQLPLACSTSSRNRTKNISLHLACSTNYEIPTKHAIASRLLYELEKSHETLRVRRVMRLLCFVEQARGAKRNRRVARGTVFLSVLTFLLRKFFLCFFDFFLLRNSFGES